MKGEVVRPSRVVAFFAGPSRPLWAQAWVWWVAGIGLWVLAVVVDRERLDGTVSVRVVRHVHADGSWVVTREPGGAAYSEELWFFASRERRLLWSRVETQRIHIMPARDDWSVAPGAAPTARAVAWPSRDVTRWAALALQAPSRDDVVIARSIWLDDAHELARHRALADRALRALAAGSTTDVRGAPWDVARRVARTSSGVCVMAIAPLLMMARGVSRQKLERTIARWDAGGCPRCGYAVSETGLRVCPECGCDAPASAWHARVALNGSEGMPALETALAPSIAGPPAAGAGTPPAVPVNSAHDETTPPPPSPPSRVAPAPQPGTIGPTPR